MAKYNVDYVLTFEAESEEGALEKAKEEAFECAANGLVHPYIIGARLIEE